jgi:hypothetical protein
MAWVTFFFFFFVWAVPRVMARTTGYLFNFPAF